MRGLPAFWLTDSSPIAAALAPFEWLFRRLAARRRRRQSARARPGGVPVIVVGSIFVGGTGKTPFTIWLAEQAARAGFTPGVMLRGYGGRARDWPRRVGVDSDPAEVGDEAVMIARRTGLAVVAGPDRITDRDELERLGCDLVIADDGLQHYRLARRAEVVVLDAARGLGNGRCLPAGPLREPPERLRTVTLVVGNGGAVDERGYQYRLRPGRLLPVVAPSVDAEPPQPPKPGSRVHGVAGIGDPQRFFASLSAMGYDVVPHAFADHHAYRERDLAFGDDLPIVMTEKDAVKCAAIGRDGLWYLPVTAEPDERTRGIIDRLLARIRTEKASDV